RGRPRSALLPGGIKCLRRFRQEPLTKAAAWGAKFGGSGIDIEFSGTEILGTTRYLFHLFPGMVVATHRVTKSLQIFHARRSHLLDEFVLELLYNNVVVFPFPGVPRILH